MDITESYLTSFMGTWVPSELPTKVYHPLKSILKWKKKYFHDDSNIATLLYYLSCGVQTTKYKDQQDKHDPFETNVNIFWHTM